MEKFQELFRVDLVCRNDICRFGSHQLFFYQTGLRNYWKNKKEKGRYAQKINGKRKLSSTKESQQLRQNGLFDKDRLIQMQDLWDWLSWAHQCRVFALLPMHEMFWIRDEQIQMSGLWKEDW